MAVDRNTRLARALTNKDAPTQAPTVTRRQGEVVSVQVDGTATVTIGGDPETVAGVASYTHYTPVAGDTVELEVQDTEATIIGKLGSGVTAFVTSGIIVTSTARAATTYGDLPSDVGPSLDVTVGPSGILLVGLSCQIQATSDNDGGAATVVLSGANTIAASDDWRIAFCVLAPGATNTFCHTSRTHPFIGLTPGVTTIKMVYKDLFDTGNDVLYARRELWAMPL